jgi:hypothetical protein
LVIAPIDNGCVSTPVVNVFSFQGTIPISRCATGVPPGIRKKARKELTKVLANKAQVDHFLNPSIGARVGQSQYIRIEQGKVPQGGCNMQAQLNDLDKKDAANNGGRAPWKNGSTVAQVLVLDAAFKALEAKGTYNRQAILNLITSAFMESFDEGKTVQLLVTVR